MERLMKRFMERNKEDKETGVQTCREAECSACGRAMDGETAYANLYICPDCGKYLPVGAKERLLMTVDESSFEPWFEDLALCDPLHTPGYTDKLAKAQHHSGSSEAVTVGCGRIGGMDAVIGVCDPHFMIGSMGHVMGERITRAFERAAELALPVVLFCCSGGARMQEGIIALMQMEKTAAAIRRHSDAGLFYCTVLTDPTMGGVTASFATLADVILAEPKARIGFAGPRVIQQTLGQALPEGFQTAEFMLRHGMVDEVVRRGELRERLAFLLRIHRRQESVQPAEKSAYPSHAMDEDTQALMNEKTCTPWEMVKMCRSGERAKATDYIKRIFTDFTELHGDRCFGDDQALVGGVAYIGGQPVTVLAYLRGKSVEERFKRNFGMPKPEGYRKAIRLMKQAEKFGRPVISFINTSGAFCGIDAEERGQGHAIAESIMVMSALKVPTLGILIGEGGSGGALAAAVGNEVWMLENSTYAIVSPEGYSSILWKTESRAEEAASMMKLTAQDLVNLGVIDRIIPEFGGANAQTVDRIADLLRSDIAQFLKKYAGMSAQAVAKERYERFRRF